MMETKIGEIIQMAKQLGGEYCGIVNPFENNFHIFITINNSRYATILLRILRSCILLCPVIDRMRLPPTSARAEQGQAFSCAINTTIRITMEEITKEDIFMLISSSAKDKLDFIWPDEDDPDFLTSEEFETYVTDDGREYNKWDTPVFLNLHYDANSGICAE